MPVKPIYCEGDSEYLWKSMRYAMDKNQYVLNMYCLKNFRCLIRNSKRVKCPFILPPEKIWYLWNNIFKLSRPILEIFLIRKTKLKTEVPESIAFDIKLVSLKPIGHFENWVPFYPQYTCKEWNFEFLIFFLFYWVLFVFLTKKITKIAIKREKIINSKLRSL